MHHQLFLDHLLVVCLARLLVVCLVPLLVVCLVHLLVMILLRCHPLTRLCRHRVALQRLWTLRMVYLVRLALHHHVQALILLIQ